MWTSVKIVKKPASSDKNAFVRDDAGSLTIFSLFLFILILFISGMAVDLMRYENERVGLQNSIDTAVIAASSITQSADTDAEVTALVKEYVAKAGYNPDIVSVTPDLDSSTGVVTSRSVIATADFNMDTMFMNMMGIDTLQGHAVTAAREGQQLIEIALVLDVSGSMGNNNKLENLKVAAKNFVTTVLTLNGTDRVSISIVPYNQQVYMTDELAGYMTNQPAPRLSLTDVQMTVNATSPHPGAIANYQTLDTTSRCARFHTEDFAVRRLADATTVEASAMYSNRDIGMDAPENNEFWCGENFPRIMLYENNETNLHNHIEGLSASGWTAIDYGMNWGVGILDPSFAPIVTDMVANNELPATMAGHPVAYSNDEVLKYVVLMTDGINTRHWDLKPEFKSGPTRIWHSQERVDQAGNGDFFDGFLVEMPGFPAPQRWYAPRSPYDSNDDEDVHLSAFPSDAVQWDYHKLYNRFSIDAVADYFFANSGDATAFNEHQNAEMDSGGYGTADTRVRSICTEAAADNDGDGINDIEVFTVAFEAPLAAETLLADCASKTGNAFVANGSTINGTFDAIATQISQLKLTQ